MEAQEGADKYHKERMAESDEAWKEQIAELEAYLAEAAELGRAGQARRSEFVEFALASAHVSYRTSHRPTPPTD